MDSKRFFEIEDQPVGFGSTDPKNTEENTSAQDVEQQDAPKKKGVVKKVVLITLAVVAAAVIGVGTWHGIKYWGNNNQPIDEKPGQTDDEKGGETEKQDEPEKQILSQKFENGMYIVEYLVQKDGKNYINTVGYKNIKDAEEFVSAMKDDKLETAEDSFGKYDYTQEAMAIQTGDDVMYVAANSEKKSVLEDNERIEKTEQTQQNDNSNKASASVIEDNERIR